MTLVDWFLIQAPLIREVLITKSVICLLLCAWLPILDVSRKWVVGLFVYAFFASAVASVIPGKSEVEKIQELRKASR